MDDIGGRLTQIMWDCFLVKQAIEAAAAGAASINVAERVEEQLPADGSPVPLRPYAEIVADFRVGFEANSGLEIEVRHSRADVPVLGGNGAARGIDLTVFEVGTSNWLAIEYIWDWAPILAKRSVHVLLEASALPGTVVKPRLRLRAVTGERIDIESRQFRLGQERQMHMISLIIPDTIEMQFDLTERPEIILFLDLAPVVVSMSRLFVW
jgi:hypothetical protein